jgi:hypothetical protein
MRPNRSIQRQARQHAKLHNMPYTAALRAVQRQLHQHLFVIGNDSEKHAYLTNHIQSNPHQCIIFDDKGWSRDIEGAYFVQILPSELFKDQSLIVGDHEVVGTEEHLDAMAHCIKNEKIIVMSIVTPDDLQPSQAIDWAALSFVSFNLMFMLVAKLPPSKRTMYFDNMFMETLTTASLNRLSKVQDYQIVCNSNHASALETWWIHNHRKTLENNHYTIIALASNGQTRRIIAKEMKQTEEAQATLLLQLKTLKNSSYLQVEFE